MKVQRARSLSGCWYVYFVAQNGDTFGLESFVFERDAQQYEDRARLALAAHDAELDKTRFVELTEQNKQLRLQLCRVMAAGPGDIEASIRILQRHREIQSYIVAGPALRNELEIRDARIRVLESDLQVSKAQYETVSQLAAGRLKCANDWLNKYHRVREAVKKVAEGGF